jgi:hypothetical protein
MQRNIQRENRKTPSSSTSDTVGRRENARSGKSLVIGDKE